MILDNTGTPARLAVCSEALEKSICENFDEEDTSSLAQRDDDDPFWSAVDEMASLRFRSAEPRFSCMPESLPCSSLLFCLDSNTHCTLNSSPIIAQLSSVKQL